MPKLSQWNRYNEGGSTALIPDSVLTLPVVHDATKYRNTDRGVKSSVLPDTTLTTAELQHKKQKQCLSKLQTYTKN